MEDINKKSPRNLNEKIIGNKREKIRKLEDQLKRFHISYELQKRILEIQVKKLTMNFLKEKKILRIEGPESPN